MDEQYREVVAQPDPTAFPALARRLVFNRIAARLATSDLHVRFTEDMVYVVWFAYTLGNWKALVSTTLPDGRYYEVTYDRDKRVAYIDTYIKLEHETAQMG